MRVLLSILVLCLAAPFDAEAHDPRGRDGPGDLASLARRVEGGAALVHALVGSKRSEVFFERARRLENRVADDETRKIREAWEKTVEAFREVAPTLPADGRAGFLLEHLSEELEDGARLVERLPAGSSGGKPGEISLLSGVACVGRGAADGERCREPRDEIAFQLPREVGRIRKIIAEWRSPAKGVSAEVSVGGQVLWRTGVKRGWEVDAKQVGHEVDPGARRLRVRSPNGSPIFVRRIEIRYDPR